MQGNPSANATRRGFLGAMSAASYERVMGANDRIQLGLIGYGLIGGRHLEDFKKQPDAEMAAICDVYQPRVEKGQAAAGGRAKGYRDFRQLLDDNDIQAVVVATPDHWHAMHTILACAAGKDVYVEKPLTVFAKEGRWMTNAARKYKRIVQVGTQQRSGKHFQEAIRLMKTGHLGKIHSIRINSARNIWPGFGVTPEAAPPTDLDYDMWLGPAPKRPYTRHRALYHFRWFWDYSGGQMTNLGTHHVDIVHWAMEVKGPKAVSSMGGRYVLQDDGETPDTQDAIFDYNGFSVAVSIREGSSGRRGGGDGFEIYGTKGSMTVSRGGFEVFPDMKVPPENQIPPWSNPPGHPARVEFKPEPLTQAMKAPGSSDEQMDLHKRNFLDCIKSRQRPIADVEEGHQVASACHLANISLRLGGRLIRWDAVREEILGDKEASAYLVRPYRKPWDEALRSLHL